MRTSYNLWIQRSASDTVSPQATAVMDNASAASPVNADFAHLNLSSKDLQKAPTTPQAFLSKKIYYEATTDINVADIKEGKFTYKQVLCGASIKINRKHNIVAVPLFDVTQHLVSLNLASKIRPDVQRQQSRIVVLQAKEELGQHHHTHRFH